MGTESTTARKYCQAIFTYTMKIISTSPAPRLPGLGFGASWLAFRECVAVLLDFIEFLLNSLQSRVAVPRKILVRIQIGAIDEYRKSFSVNRIFLVLQFLL